MDIGTLPLSNGQTFWLLPSVSPFWLENSVTFRRPRGSVTFSSPSSPVSCGWDSFFCPSLRRSSPWYSWAAQVWGKLPGSPVAYLQFGSVWYFSRDYTGIMGVIQVLLIQTSLFEERLSNYWKRAFSGGPVAKTPSSQGTGPGLDIWSRN